MKNKRALWLALCFLALSCLFFSCSSLRHSQSGAQDALSKVYVTDKISVPLLETSAIAGEVDEYQYFEGSFAQRKFSSLLYLHADSTQINVLMLSEMGVEIGSIAYDGEACSMQSAFFPKNMKAEYIILDLQNTYCSADTLYGHYKKYSLDFAEDGNVRTLSKDGKVIEQIERNGNTITINNVLRSYTYTLVTES